MYHVSCICIILNVIRSSCCLPNAFVRTYACRKLIPRTTTAAAATAEAAAIEFPPTVIALCYSRISSSKNQYQDACRDGSRKKRSRQHRFERWNKWARQQLSAPAARPEAGNGGGPLQWLEFRAIEKFEIDPRLTFMQVIW